LIGWVLILEYTIGGAAVVRGITPNLVWCCFIFLFSFCFFYQGVDYTNYFTFNLLVGDAEWLKGACGKSLASFPQVA